MADDDNAANGSSQDSEPRRSPDQAWDRYGTYLESVQSMWDRLARRNFDFWKDVSANLKNKGVTADTLAENTGKALAVAQETMEDLWYGMVEPPQREVFVQVLPTAFLFFDKVTASDGTRTYVSPDPVHIPVSQQRLGPLPDEAKITLSGNPTSGADAADAIEALTERLTAERQQGLRSYLLQTVTRGDAKPLAAGTYDGLIYLTEPVLPLANLRVVVEGPPPEVDSAT